MITIKGGPDPYGILITDEDGKKINDVASIEISKIEPGMAIRAKLEVYVNIDLCAEEDIIPIRPQYGSLTSKRRKKPWFDHYFKYLAKGFLRL